jgi:hypothetical protein
MRRSTRRWTIAAAIGAASAAIVVCSSPATATTVTLASQPWTPPQDISSAQFDVAGASGGSSASSPGGAGGEVVATIPVTTGQQLNAFVGAAGSPPVGMGSGPFGGPGGASGGAGAAGGGGYTFLSRGNPLDHASWLLVAGGGGGAGFGAGHAGGAGGGPTGQDGSSASVPCQGQGANQDGTRGSGNLSAASLGASNGGGGGGGYYGGGGGSCSGGGGGGSGFVAPAITGATFPTPTNTGNGFVTVTYFTLHVITDGPGEVTGTGLFCNINSGDCTQSVAPGDQIAFEPKAIRGGAFTGYTGGGCGTSPACSVTIAADVTVTASFVGEPTTEITKKPSKRTKKTVAKFKFRSSQADATFECSLDDAKFKRCHSPLKVTVEPGKHMLAIRSVGPAGNAEVRPVKTTWKVVPKAPSSLVRGPAPG